VNRGTQFSVEVSLSIENRSPETNVTQTGPGASVDARGRLAMILACRPQCDIEVVLHAPAFDIKSGANTGHVQVFTGSESVPALFKLRARADAPTGPARLESSFWYRGAFIARAMRTIQIAAAPPEMASASVAGRGARATPPARLPLETAAPDLTVRWEDFRVGGRDSCEVEVASPYLQSVRSEACPSSRELPEFLAGRYRRLLSAAGLNRGFNAVPERSEVTADEMRGLGRELYEHWTPSIFRDAFWKLVDRERRDANFHFRSIQIFTNNPALPWELLVPARADGSETRGFLGAEFEIARWHIGDRVRDLPPLAVPLDTIAAIAPHYSGQQNLPHQAEEMDAVRSMPGFRAVGGDLHALLGLLDNPPEGIVHFAGHGVAKQVGQSSYEYAIQLEDSAIDPTMWRAHTGKPAGPHPLYFLNACESGQETQIASFIDGWAGAILESGASGFIGGLWPLSDSGAMVFSKEFYKTLWDRVGAGEPASVASLVELARRKFAETGDPTFMAYVFYGDARLRVTPPNRR
jgi:CHAT domain